MNGRMKRYCSRCAEAAEGGRDGEHAIDNGAWTGRCGNQQRQIWRYDLMSSLETIPLLSEFVVSKGFLCHNIAFCLNRSY